MTTTTTADWNPALIYIVRQALLNGGMIDENENVPAAAYEDGLFKINALMKELEATGIHVWTEQEAILFLQPGQVRYPIGGTVTTNTSDSEDWEIATLAVNAVSGATSVTVTDAAGLVAGTNIGIVLDDNSTFWTTVRTTPTTTVIALTDALTDDAGSGNNVLSYTSAILRPLRIPNARLLRFTGMNETVMTVMSRQEYMDLPNKTQSGVPTMFFYSPQMVSGLLYVWPAPSNSTYAVRFTWYRPIFDFTDAADTSDVPQEWVNALIWVLAREFAPSYGVSDAMWARIKEMADAKLDLVISYDRESEPIQFGMEWQGR